MEPALRDTRSEHSRDTSYADCWVYCSCRLDARSSRTALAQRDAKSGSRSHPEMKSAQAHGAWPTRSRPTTGRPASGEHTSIGKRDHVVFGSKDTAEGPSAKAGIGGGDRSSPNCELASAREDACSGLEGVATRRLIRSLGTPRSDTRWSCVCFQRRVKTFKVKTVISADWRTPVRANGSDTGRAGLDRSSGAA